MNAIITLGLATDAKIFGGKAANLAKLLQNNLPVPNGFAIGLNAFDDGGKLISEAKTKITELIDGQKLYAVRSSALAEDANDTSWAGQFETFLNTKPADILAKVEECHSSAKDRAKAYAGRNGDFQIAVVVQEMLSPQYAGVLFTNNPVSSKEEFITEYVNGLGESLVSGEVTPKRIEWQNGELPDAPFDIKELTKLANKTERVFKCPQDIEWAWDGNKLWLTQARPITTTAKKQPNFNLGEPDQVFYWGPSRATTFFMGDFVTALEKFFMQCAQSKTMPNPPKTFALFHDDKVVYLINAASYSKFTVKLFELYAEQNRLEDDFNTWRQLANELLKSTKEEFNKKIIGVWEMTEFAEFALYGAERAIVEKLVRFDERTRIKIWGAFSTPDKSSFLNLLDEELAKSRDTKTMAKKYPWIRDGYAGSNNEAEWYFAERLKAIDENGLLQFEDQSAKREQLATEYNLSKDEISMLNLARRLAEFMDERKEWMMKTRRQINKPLSKVKYGWFFDGKKVRLVNEENAKTIWERYIEFKSSSNIVKGTVANTGGHHFVSGEVAVLHSHTDPVANDKILVVPSTSPGWVPLMRRARALVTDHGGMMSHAAIVAREFCLPCIVGTGYGTKSLHDGDEIVLDLVTGEVGR